MSQSPRSPAKRKKNDPRLTGAPTEEPIVPGRKVLFDVLRGLAIVAMVAYHFCFDLDYHGYTRFDFHHDPFWLTARAGILGLFLGLVGVGLVYATADGFKPRRYFRRLATLAAAALLVSLASRTLFPNSWIFFGVLHFILLASLLGLLFLRFSRLNVLIASGLLWAGNNLQHAFFDQPVWQWIGLMTHKPITEDYVPLLPWFGVVLIGIALGRFFHDHPRGRQWADWRGEHAIARGLALAGRHSLLIYLLHQPLLLGLLWLARPLAR